MIVDSSALLTILLNEPEERRISVAILGALSRSISAATLLETAMAFESRAGAQAVAELDRLVIQLNLEIVSFTANQAQIAREAFRRYGKGRHAARLNFGDCIAYALAKDWGEPLLFKGDDFSKTDIEAVPY